MARISQYKALGTKMGGYKTTLSKVQSMEYAKKHADWKAGEQKALYGEIGGTVANIIGIADETRKLKDLESRRKSLLEPMAKPDRPTVGVGTQEPDEITAGDFDFLDANEKADLGIADDVTGTKTDESAMQIRGPESDVVGEAPTMPLPTTAGVHKAELDWDKSKKEGMWKVLGQEGEVVDASQKKPTAASRRNLDENIPPLVMKAMQTYDEPIGPFVGRGSGEGLSNIVSSTTKSPQRGFDDTLERIRLPSERRSVASVEPGTPVSGGHHGGKLYRQEEDFTMTNMGEIKDLYGARESIRTGRGFDVKRKYDYISPAGDTTTYEVTGTSDKSVKVAEAKADRDALVSGVSGRMSDYPIAKPERPGVSPTAYRMPDAPESLGYDMVTDDMAFDTLTDTSLGDFDMGALPSTSPLERQLVSKMKERGLNIGTKEINQMVSEFASVESGGKDIRQITPDDVKAGRKTGTGKGAGYFQFETGKGQGFETGLNRVINMYKKIGKKVPSWVQKAKKDGTPIGLSKEQQRELLIANLYQQEDHSKRVAGGTDFDVMVDAFESGDFSELWAKRHWAGADAEYEGKIAQYKRDRGGYKY